MSWIKLDDQFFTNAKVLQAGVAARDLYLAGLAFCASGLTDGAVPACALPILAGMAGVPDGEACARRLLEVGLWEATRDGYQVHDYLEYNPSREEAMALRTARARAGQRGGRASARARRVRSRAAGGPEGPVPVDADGADAAASGQADGEQTPTPSPSPYPYPSPNPCPVPGREGGGQGADGGDAAPEDGPAGAGPAPPGPKGSAGEGETAAKPGKGPPRNRHPLAELWRQHMGSYPNATQEAEIVASVKDPELFARCLKAWRMHGYRPANARGVLDWYTAGGPPEGRLRGGHQGPAKSSQAESAILCPRCHAHPCICESAGAPEVAGTAPDVDPYVRLRAVRDELRLRGYGHLLRAAEPQGVDDQGRLIMRLSPREQEMCQARPGIARILEAAGVVIAHPP